VVLYHKASLPAIGIFWQIMLNRGIVLFYADAITALKHSFSGLLSARLS